MPGILKPIAVPEPQLQLKASGEKKPAAVVVGAGAFGGWTARDLQRAGYAVTLLDAWGPGNSRSSSGDETRVIRAVYGDDGQSTRNSARAMKLWRGLGEEGGERIFHESGVLWLVKDDDAFVRASLPHLAREGLRLRDLDLKEAKIRYSQVDFDGISKAYYEPEAGFLLAQRACRLVFKLLRERGGRYLQTAAKPGEFKGGKLRSVILDDGSELRAELFVFACGPWLGSLFPEVIGDRIKPTRQEMFYFGVAPGRSELTTSSLPVWIELGSALTLYGVPAGGHHGFKAADDTRGPGFDPTNGERLVSAASVDDMRRRLAARFPAIKDAPLLETRVCQYEDTPDRRFILDRHPEARNLILLGGGSGHGFKQAPVVGELAARVAEGRMEPPLSYSLSRFAPNAGAQ